VELTAEAREVVKAHVDRLVFQLAHIIAGGVAEASGVADDPVTVARAVFQATSRFHNPAFEWSDAKIDADYRCVRDLVLSGLGARPLERS
jgi:hypothetical protein